MGAWGTGSFSNDGALDFVNEVVQAREPMATIKLVLDAVGDPSLWSEVPSCSAAVAAAEIVAALQGRPAADLPDDLVVFISQTPKPDPDLATEARAALECVRTHSELRDLWGEVGKLDEWEMALTERSRRLD